jgi:hypothetical protein
MKRYKYLYEGKGLSLTLVFINGGLFLMHYVDKYGEVLINVSSGKPSQVKIYNKPQHATLSRGRGHGVSDIIRILLTGVVTSMDDHFRLRYQPHNDLTEIITPIELKPYVETVFNTLYPTIVGGDISQYTLSELTNKWTNSIINNNRAKGEIHV